MLAELQTQGKNVLCKESAHMEIKGNEEMNKTAKQTK